MTKQKRDLKTNEREKQMIKLLKFSGLILASINLFSLPYLQAGLLTFILNIGTMMGFAIFFDDSWEDKE